MKKRIAWILVIAMAAFPLGAFASILGDVVDSWSLNMGTNTYLHNTVFNTSSVGKQTEYYVEYQPNEDIVPIVVNGESLYGRRNILQAADYMQANGMRPLIGINADYFSFKTGLPMGHTIMNGEIAGKEDAGQDAIGFLEDGSAFMSWLEIQTTLRREQDPDSSLDITYINKWCQPGSVPVYLLNDQFGKETKTETECMFVILNIDEGALKFDQTMTMTVEESFVYDGNVTIPEGKVVLVMDTGGDAYSLDYLKSLQPGEKIKVTNEAVYDKELWSQAQSGIGCIGGRLIENGVVNTNFEAGAAPRTAVGITADGNLIFYVLDGRQPGYSYGAQLKTLASRMQELGCVEALNLDGGGSTSIAGIYPGSDVMSVVNAPSEGALRSVSNFIFLKDNRLATGIAGYMRLAQPAQESYQSPATEQIVIEDLFDTNNYRMEQPEDIEYTVENTGDSRSWVENNGIVHLEGTGEAIVKVSTGATSATVTYRVVEQNPFADTNGHWAEKILTQMAQRNIIKGVEQDGGLYFFPDQDMTRVQYASMISNYMGIDLSAYDGNDLDFADEQQIPLWARSAVQAMVEKGILQGRDNGGQMYFAPDDKITRAEAMTILGRLLPEDAEKAALTFADGDQIPDWAKESMQKLLALGVIQGYSDNTILPQNYVKRAEAVTMLYRFE